MTARWHLLMWPPLLLSLALLVGSQSIFLRGSFFADLRVGRLGSELTLQNYWRVASDGFYLSALWLTVRLSALVVVFTFVLGYPTAYILARMRSVWAPLLLALLVATSFVTIVIKVLGLVILFSPGGLLNVSLLWLGLTDQPVSLRGTEFGVVVGLMYFTIGFFVLLLYGVVRTIPRSLEQAAQLLGAPRWRVFWRVVVPLSLPGIITSALVVFNLCMGAFTSAALIGAGRILTLPVLIQRTVMLDARYAMGATLAAVLLLCGLAINLISILAVGRLKAARRVVA
ncbi:MAG: ABC transporter permease [Proteobacteria bacterium]|nr:ABC transporter permease [Pseudomonadota bacterium]